MSIQGHPWNFYTSKTQFKIQLKYMWTYTNPYFKLPIFWNFYNKRFLKKDKKQPVVGALGQAESSPALPGPAWPRQGLAEPRPSLARPAWPGQALAGLGQSLGRALCQKKNNLQSWTRPDLAWPGSGRAGPREAQWKKRNRKRKSGPGLVRPRLGWA